MNRHSFKQTKFDVIKDNKLVIVLLKYLGIDLFHKKEDGISFSFLISAYLIPLVHYLFYVERLLTFIPYIMVDPASMKLYVAYMLQYTGIFISWHIFYLRKEHIGRSLTTLQKNLLKLKLQNIPRDKSYFPLFSKVMVFTIAVFPLAYGVAEYLALMHLPFFYLYTAEVDKSSVMWQTHMIIRGIACSFERETFCGAVCFLYSLICWRLCYSFQNYRLFLEASTTQNNKSVTVPKDFFANYILLLDAAEEMDACFSVPIFSMTVVYGFSLFNLLASSLSIVGGSFPAISMLTISTNVASTAVFLTVNVMTAAQVPLEVEKNVHLFYVFHEEAVIAPSRLKLSKKDIKLLNIIKTRDDVFLSGCHVIYFSRGLLLTIVGVLITYGLLFMNFESL